MENIGTFLKMKLDSRNTVVGKNNLTKIPHNLRKIFSLNHSSSNSLSNSPPESLLNFFCHLLQIAVFEVNAKAPIPETFVLKFLE